MNLAQAMKIFLSICTVVLMACHSLKPTQMQQGISGYVYRQSGNQMPGPNRAPQKPQGLKCDLYIYQPTKLNRATGSTTIFTTVSSKLVLVVHTDSTGHYKANLPTGRYSVFISTDKHEFFADESDGEGILNPIEVLEGKVTERNWVYRKGAAY
ncbi:hypothetical protein [Mucilaginibacter agri]|uniref:Carboxypeptidase regulatory-like domain-containing protein n=1 Tax=Mucilaginibacter agri TaxID=2695265 RepID=A0A966DVK1_9SPHI|nr:hypothetical protein [Mucilaginibacter agri]NCD71546.1 hypothetical protein [Mucilaginibacter agri]